jgi:hypothetical protein
MWIKVSPTIRFSGWLTAAAELGVNAPKWIIDYPSCHNHRFSEIDNGIDSMKRFGCEEYSKNGESEVKSKIRFMVAY